MATDKPIRILIVEDHSVVRMGILNLLRQETDIELVGEAGNGKEALALIPQLRPDIILIGITLPRSSGLEVMQASSRLFPAGRFLVFSINNDPDYILSAVQNGAAGYLPKNTDRAEILKAIRMVHGGELYYPPNASSIIIRSLVTQKPLESATQNQTESFSSTSIWHRITVRENQILQCLTEGLSSKDIARRFDVSPHTVANQRASIIRKARVKNTAELVSLALRERS